MDFRSKATEILDNDLKNLIGKTIIPKPGRERTHSRDVVIKIELDPSYGNIYDYKIYLKYYKSWIRFWNIQSNYLKLNDDWDD